MVWTVVMLSVIVVCAGVTAYGGLYFYGVGVKRAPKIFMTNNKDLPKDLAANPPVAGGSWGEGQNWISRQSIRNVEIVSDDGLKLRGYWIASDKAQGRTAILAHGYTGKGKDMGAWAKIYHDTLGYNVLIPDARGHGASEGGYIGFGWHERLDYLKWIRYVVGQEGPDAQILLHGVSMGGATVLMTSGEELPPQVKAIVSDCAYTSVRDQLAYQLRRMYKLPAFPFISSASLVTRLKAGYSFRQASALKQVRRAKVPILFIHGDADTFVPFYMMDQLYDACGGPKERYVVAGAGHGTAYDRDPAAYTSRIAAFAQRHLLPSSSGQKPAGM